MKMREITFRAWDKAEKKMKLPTLFRLGRDLPFTDDNNAGKVYQCQCNGNSHIEYYSLGDNLILTQFTGLTDKNGKKIFEGDLWKRESFIGIVEFKWSQWELTKAPSSGCYSYPSFHSNAVTGEIIGNIYENPELLQN
jgi:hypothetical protein